MADDAQLGNYKGVMLCNRPGNNGLVNEPKPFLSRAHCAEEVGLRPIRAHLPPVELVGGPTKVKVKKDSAIQRNIDNIKKLNLVKREEKFAREKESGGIGQDGGNQGIRALSPSAKKNILAQAIAGGAGDTSETANNHGFDSANNATNNTVETMSPSRKMISAAEVGERARATAGVTSMVKNRDVQYITNEKKKRRRIPGWVKDRWNDRMKESSRQQNLAETQAAEAEEAQRNANESASVNAAVAKMQESAVAPDIDDMDTGGLIDFAENLNIEEYLDDLEFRNALTALRDRARKLEGVETHFKSKLAHAVSIALKEADVEAFVQSAEPGSSMKFKERLAELESEIGELEEARRTGSEIGVGKKEGNGGGRKRAGSSDGRSKETLEKGWDANSAKVTDAVVEEAHAKFKGVHSKQSTARLSDTASSVARSLADVPTGNPESSIGSSPKFDQ